MAAAFAIRVHNICGKRQGNVREALVSTATQDGIVVRLCLRITGPKFLNLSLSLFLCLALPLSPSVSLSVFICMCPLSVWLSLSHTHKVTHTYTISLSLSVCLSFSLSLCPTSHIYVFKYVNGHLKTQFGSPSRAL